jgi:hypothetical protein
MTVKSTQRKLDLYFLIGLFNGSGLLANRRSCAGFLLCVRHVYQRKGESPESDL